MWNIIYKGYLCLYLSCTYLYMYLLYKYIEKMLFILNHSPKNDSSGKGIQLKVDLEQSELSGNGRAS